MHGRSTLRDLDDMPTSTPLELERAPTPQPFVRRDMPPPLPRADTPSVDTPRPVQFGNLTVRPIDDTPPEPPIETVDPARLRVCPKCAFGAAVDDLSCPKCGVIFSKMRATLPPPRFELRESPSDIDVAMEDASRSYEARVLSMLASLTFIALAVTSNVPSINGADMFTMLGVFQLIALLTWFGARIFDWGVKAGAVGIILLFFLTGWLWPLCAKGVSWLAGLVGVNLPRATGWIATAVALAAAVAVAVLR